MASRKTEFEKADLLGEGLVGNATEIASFILNELGKFDNGIEFRSENTTTQFLIEVIVFYMHLVDRLAFAHLSEATREIFCDRFVVAMVREVLRELARDISADEFVNALRDTHNRRQMEYARYKALIPREDEPQKDTLYWEFSKVLFGFLNDSNPARLVFLNLLVADATNVMLNDALRVEEVLQS
jgi:hypothetical protein